MYEGVETIKASSPQFNQIVVTPEDDVDVCAYRLFSEVETEAET